MFSNIIIKINPDEYEKILRVEGAGLNPNRIMAIENQAEFCCEIL